MNRETKRLLQRQGQMDEEGNPALGNRRQPKTIQPDRRAVTDRERRDNLLQRSGDFFRAVSAELRRVAWPTRAETLNSAFVVLIAVVVLTAAIFGLDTGFSKFVLYLFKQ